MNNTVCYLPFFVVKLAKTTNYSALYGVGAKKLARELGISISDAVKLLEAFWEVNWAVRATAKEQYLKTLKDGSVWLKNPVSGFYYSLRYEKDIWSTLNQSTGVYGFDTWIAYSQSLGVDIVLQMHDEVVVECDEDKVETVRETYILSPRIPLPYSTRSATKSRPNKAT